MNWLMIAVVGGAAAWFEYSYRRSQRQPKKSPAQAPGSSANVEQAGQVREVNQTIGCSIDHAHFSH